MSKLPKKESATVEFKASFNEDVIETLVAFAKDDELWTGASALWCKYGYHCFYGWWK